MKIEDYLEEKKVIVVGPAPTLINLGLGSKIDNYDVVVRFNNYIDDVDKYNDYGSKNDILYVNTFFARKYKNRILDSAAKYIIYKTKKFLPKEIEDRFEVLRPHEHGTFHNLGILAILDLLKYSILSLTVTGFSFYSDKTDVYLPGYKLIDHIPPRNDIEIPIILDLVENNRIEVWEDTMKFIRN